MKGGYLLAEFDAPEDLAGAIGALRNAGARDLNAYTPYSTETVREALGYSRSKLPIFVFVVGVLAAAAAYFLQWYLVAYLYPLNVGNRPAHMPLAFVPITFEMGVLFASIAAVAGVFVLSRLFCLWHPVFEAEGFESASLDKFWLALRLGGKGDDVDELKHTLEAHGAKRQVVVIGGDP